MVQSVMLGNQLSQDIQGQYPAILVLFVVESNFKQEFIGFSPFFR